MADTHSLVRDGQRVFIGRVILAWHILYREKEEFSQFLKFLCNFTI